jgi:predicted unusual protein kinase regulating ubiquinone biosynthesis (AarF/ABC1/UbiB family)
VFERNRAARRAALGQVTERPISGREVVVKVLRPGVEGVVGEDLDVSFRILSCSTCCSPTITSAITPS